MSEYVTYDGRLVSTATELGKEIAKFEKPYVYSKYPKMMYRAARTPSGQVRVMEAAIDHSATIWKDAELSKEENRIEFFNRKNQHTVRDEVEHREALNQGWRDHPDDALKYFEQMERERGNAAAERAAQDSKMSEKAQAEAAAADAETEFHLPEIPVKRRGRPRKVA